MKDDDLYPYFLSYLTQRLIEGKINKGSFSLQRMSNLKFDQFKDRYNTDELFYQKVIELHKSEIRDKKIDDIFDEFN